MTHADQPLVSIVTAVFNGMPHVVETLESVAAQDYPALEHWLVDGGSVDGTLEFIRSRGNLLAGCVAEPKRGIAIAFNRGLERVRGEYIMFLNSDDALASPVALSRLVAAARSSGWPDVIYGDCDVVERDSGKLLYRHAVDFDRERFLRGGTLPHPGMLMHRRYFERFGRFDTSYAIAMDYELQLRGVPEVGAVHATVLVTRVRTGGESTRDPRRVTDENMRALRSTGQLSPAAEARLRAYYGLRSAARRFLSALGLYRPFAAARARLRKES